jgi:signal transduction histidine kinase
LLRSLGGRLFVAFVFIIVLTLAIGGLVFFRLLGGYRDQVTTGTLREVALPVYYNLTLFSPRINRPTEIGAYLAKQAEETDVIILLLDREGRVVRDVVADPSMLNERFELPPLGPTFRDLYEGGHLTEDGQDLLFVAVALPRPFLPERLGGTTLVVALPKDNAQSIIGDLMPRLLVAGLIGLGAALVVGLVLSRSIYQPLRRMTRAVRAVASGDYRQKVPVTGPTEARELAEDVNRMTDAVQRSQQTLREFLANVSHELKTPLTSIRGFSQAMVDGTLADRAGQERAARVIEAESRRVLHLVEELLDLSRIESGQEEMARAPVKLEELFQHVGDVFSLRSRETGVALEIASPQVPDVLGDFDRLEQVLGNLLDNAFRHTPAGGTVRLTAREAADRMVEVSVADTGEGIPPEELPRVFDRFYRGDLAGPLRGTGLGLAVSREIARAHGGDIRAESEPGSGTRFVFTLPIAPRHGAEA